MLIILVIFALIMNKYFLCNCLIWCKNIYLQRYLLQIWWKRCKTKKRFEGQLGH